MENRTPDTPRARMAGHTLRLGLPALLMLMLSACERPGVPPSPVDPARPKMQVGKNMGEVQRAIFHYIRPVRKASSSMEPDTVVRPEGRLQV